MQKIAGFFLLLLVVSTALHADNWSHWRGETGLGYSKERNLPSEWNAQGKNVRWKVKLPSSGMSTPIVWGNKVFLTQALDAGGTQRALICFDAKTGKQIWQKVTEYKEAEATYDREPHYCSGSPATDGERVVASFASAGVVCYDLNGKLLWKKDLGKSVQIWGTAASPIIYKNLVILNFGPGERSFLIALDKKTGDEVWRVDFPGNSGEGNDMKNWFGSWSTPVVAKIGNREELILTIPNEVRAFNPLNGKELWRCKGAGPLFYTSPLVTKDVVIAISGFNGPALAVKPGGNGDVTETHRLWREEKTTQRIGSGVIIGDHVFVLNENGTLQCMEWKTGKTLWNERLSSRIWGSLVHADDKLYAISQQGETVVLAAKPTFEVISRNLLNERSQSSPAISNGSIFIRTYDHLWCIGSKAE